MTTLWVRIISNDLGMEVIAKLTPYKNQGIWVIRREVRS